MHFTRRLIALAFATSLLSACFVNNLIYRHIDWIILFQLDKYFDLESSQEKFVEIAVKDTVSWFKRDRMADVIELLGIELAAAKARRLDADSTDKWFKILDEDRRLIIARTLPTMVQVGMTLSIDQIDHFAKLIDRGNRNLKLAAEAELKDFPSARDEFAESTFDRFEYLIGNLSDNQKDIIVRGMLWDQLGLQAEYQVRENSRAYWIEALKKHDQAFLEAAIKRANNLDGAVPTESYIFYRRRAENWKAVRSNLAITMSEKQWAHLEKTLSELLAELQRLGRIDQK